MTGGRQWWETLGDLVSLIVSKLVELFSLPLG